ncbi:hypothetical protein CLV58_11072 [Spirosoma oryzae]|uniref:Uncharacterized protein n=1 Tax=Spirosoma oryzae TaxID=1469603 RepID=A0A2T0SW59_9BACT|nr:hypothetical protein [Spirosoma oryzae]PRY37603.1 hypothetical protein CLV58_11072 [Spirosoma oryzae]
MRTNILFLTLLVGVGTVPAIGQTANDNQAAVDTLTKEVAKAVFRTIDQPKAQAIYAQLLTCDDGCDARDIIRTVGSWDQVGQRIEELATLKNTKNFVSMSPADANVAIRQQLAQFYQKNRAYASYAKALPPAVQQGILAKIDAMLPPNATASTDDVPPSDDPAVEDADAQSPGITGGAAEGDNISGSALQLSKLERGLNDAKDKQMWLLLGGLLAGLIVGAGGMWALARKQRNNDADDYQRQIERLAAQLDSESRKAKAATSTPAKPTPVQATETERVTPKPAPAPTPATAPPVSTDSTTVAESATVEPAVGPSKPIRTGDISTSSEPAPVTVVPESSGQVQSQGSGPIATPTPPRSQVFYCPPPDPSGQFDPSQQTDMLSPESAYRFSVDATQPTTATFRFEAEPGRLARLLTYRNYMIEPACESENTYANGHTRVAMRRDGVAVQENGVWRVKTKALIRYE